MRIVLDTNCLLVVLPVSSPYRCLWDAFRQKRFTLCYTTEMLQEYEELLSRFYPLEFVSLTVEMLLKSPNIIQTIPYYKWNFISVDPDDNKFVDCALNASADYIVTNDKHFNVLKNVDFPKINVINIDTFKTIISIL
jgi:putative PIN family toxin of toxin-antitoxin system